MQEKSPIYSSYKRNLKWLGIIEYKSLVILIIYLLIIWGILKPIQINFEMKVYIFSFLFLPVFLLFVIERDNVNSSDAIISMFKFIINRNIYVNDIKYSKEYKNNIYIKNKECLMGIVKKKNK